MTQTKQTPKAEKDLVARLTGAGEECAMRAAGRPARGQGACRYGAVVP
jgi:hypothetical protein